MRSREGTLMKCSNLFRLLLVPWLMLAAAGRSPAQDASVQITVHWEKMVQESKTTPTLQVVVNPPLRRGTAVHDNAFKRSEEPRLNSSHRCISYAVFCLKKKKSNIDSY